MNMTPKNLIANILNKNPHFNTIINMLQNGNQPQDIIQNIIKQNPNMAEKLTPLYNMVQGKNPSQLNELCANLCKEKGLTPQQIIQQLTYNN